MPTPEAKVKAAVRKILGAKGIWFFMPIPMYHRGIPDFICCMNGQFIAIETKAGRGKLTALQELCMEEIRKAGGKCLVVNENNIKDLVGWLDDCLQ